MARAIVLLKLTRKGAMSIERARAVYEDTKIFFARAGYPIVDLYTTIGEYDFVSMLEVPDHNTVEHLFPCGMLAAAHGTFQVRTMRPTIRRIREGSGPNTPSRSVQPGRKAACRNPNAVTSASLLTHALNFESFGCSKKHRGFAS
ncbi:MAG: GYD domain-containing protein [Deltaproteobacteria bacterium]|nr:GYD domain-containing protein [Deltaproteobacteria bacterium]